MNNTIKVRNPENPFVYNPHYFASAGPYTESTLYYFHNISNVGAFITGVITLCLLTYLIVAKSPARFRPYSKILLLCALNDVITLIIHILLQTRLYLSDSVIMISYNGPLSVLPYAYHGRLITLQALSATIALASLPIQYYYRYITLKLRGTPSLFKFSIYYLILISLVIIFMLLCDRAYTPGFDDVPDFDYARLWYKENPVPKLVVGSFHNYWMVAAISYATILITLCYFFVIWVARATIKELKMQEDILSSRTKALQEQFSKTLFVQALIPLFSVILPLGVMFFCTVTNRSAGYTGELIMLALTWFPTINSLSNIILIVPYREHCVKLLIGILGTIRVRTISEVTDIKTVSSSEKCVE